MTKGAAATNALGELHATLAIVFRKVLEGYETKLNTLSDLHDKVSTSDELEEDLLAAIMAANIEPSPAMLSAVARFLKDNEISVDSEEIDALSAQEERLKNRKAQRPDLKSITTLALVADG